jgi:hypothetical protein
MDIYDFTVPVFIKMLNGLKIVLKKAKAHGIDEKVLLADSLALDMFPLVRQVQIATDNAKGAAARLSGKEPPVYKDDEESIAQLMKRIDKTLLFLKKVKRSHFKDAHKVKVSLKYWNGKHLKGIDYVREYAIPNFFFHVAMAYALVRKNGVKIGKSDYMYKVPLR